MSSTDPFAVVTAEAPEAEDTTQLDYESLTEVQLREALSLREDLAHRKHMELCRADFITFCQYMDPNFMVGDHHKIMGKAFNKIVHENNKRIIINMPPRHGKSYLTSQYLPAFFIGNTPKAQLMNIANVAELAVKFGRQVKDVIGSDKFKEVFPGIEVRSDSKSAGRWQINKGGESFSAGVGSSVTGRGANLLIIDDPFTESCVSQPKVFDDVWEYYLAGPRQRLMPGGNILVVQTRWSVKDLTGKLLQEQTKNPKADQWEVIEFPAILPSGKPLWPEFWSLDALDKVKNSLDARHWNSEWLQNPTATEGAIVKKDWWMEWPSSVPPACSYIIQSYDTAYSKRETADYSVISTWGVFYPEGDYDRRNGEKRSFDGREAHVMLLDVVRDRFEFPELKDEAYRVYSFWEPDTVVVEAKGSGGPLAQEMRARGIPVQEYSPGKRKGGGGQDKITRLHSVSDFFRSGMVWAPDELWAREMIEEVQAFPAGDHDDQVDSMTMALMRFREGNFLQLTSDADPASQWRPRRKMSYY